MTTETAVEPEQSALSAAREHLAAIEKRIEHARAAYDDLVERSESLSEKLDALKAARAERVKADVSDTKVYASADDKRDQRAIGELAQEYAQAVEDCETVKATISELEAESEAARYAVSNELIAEAAPVQEKRLDQLQALNEQFIALAGDCLKRQAMVNSERRRMENIRRALDTKGGGSPGLPLAEFAPFSASELLKALQRRRNEFGVL